MNYPPYDAPSSYINIAPLLASATKGANKRLSRIDQLYHQLRDHVASLSCLPGVLLHLIASYAPPQLLLAFTRDPFPMLYALNPSAAIAAGNYTHDPRQANTSAASRRNVIPTLPVVKLSREQKYTMKARKLPVAVLQTPINDALPYTGNTHRQPTMCCTMHRFDPSLSAII